jgi:hypothetical protein
LRPTDEESSDLELDFKTMTVEGRNAVLGDLAFAAFNVLGWNYPLTEVERQQILGAPRRLAVDPQDVEPPRPDGPDRGD